MLCKIPRILYGSMTCKYHPKISLGSNLHDEIVLDITGFHDEEVFNKQNVTGCDHSENH